MSNVENNNYDSSSIDILEGLEAVRKRPGMYIGSTNSKGLHHLIWEIIDNSIDEHLAGFCTEIKLTINKDDSITISDNGRGIPVGVHPKKKITAERVIFTILHAGGKFGGGGYKVSGGLHGVGASVVNALSKYVEVEVYRDGNIYYDRYENGGNPVVKLSPNGELLPTGKSKENGTKVTFLPDDTIFETTEWKPDVIKKRIKEMSYLNKGLRIIFTDNRTGEVVEFHEEDGIVGFIKELNENTETITEPVYISGTSNEIDVEVAFQYTKEFNEQIISYCNNIATVEGGTHVTGLKTAITRIINNYAKELGVIKEKDNAFEGRDVRNGFISIVSIKHTNPQYEGQTKTKLGNTDAKGAVDDVFSTEGVKFFDRNIDTLKIIIDNAVKSVKIRKQEDKVRANLNSKEMLLQTNGKLAHCTSKDPNISEIIIVEGDSAGGSAKQGRDRKIQAILPLKGKVLNVEKGSIEKILANKEIGTFFSALGCGYGEDFDIAKLKYSKIIILTDADVDGSHIRTLLLTLIYRYMPGLIFENKVYKGIPPLYKVTHTTTRGRKKVETFKYAYSDDGLEKIKKELGNSILSIQRYKGLGEMSAEQLWDTTLNPDTRLIARIPIEDAVEADKVTNLLMGSKVEPRRNFIMEEAKNAEIDS